MYMQMEYAKNSNKTQFNHNKNKKNIKILIMDSWEREFFNVI